MKASGKGKSPAIPGRGQQSVREASSGGDGMDVALGRGTGSGDSRGAGEGSEEDEDVVFRWHVDSLMNGGDMDMVPLMEEGFGERGSML